MHQHAEYRNRVRQVTLNLVASFNK